MSEGFLYLLAVEYRKLQPLHVTEVLTVRQVLVRGIHTDSTLVLASLFGRMNHLEGIVITFVANHLQWLNREYMILAILIGIDIDLLQGYGIVKTLFVDDIAQRVVLTYEVQT